jgi:hypothetical protein
MKYKENDIITIGGNRDLYSKEIGSVSWITPNMDLWIGKKMTICEIDDDDTFYVKENPWWWVLNDITKKYNVTIFDDIIKDMKI